MPITTQQIRDLIDSTPALAAISPLNVVDIHREIQAYLPREVTTSFRDERGILAAFADPAHGEAFLQGLEAAGQTNPIVRRMVKWLGPGASGIDVGLPATRAMLDLLVAGSAVTAEAAATVKALAEAPQSVTLAQVTAALALEQ
jgi:hypothetical protein